MAQVVTAHESLTDRELSLVRGLRDIARGGARDELILLIGELVDFVRDPRCPRAQGDGVPCQSVDCSCEECQGVAGTLADLRRRLHQAH